MSNVNVGMMGHVDSGKTSLCKLLSEVASTACFDKSQQSQLRKITLDLGFSSFQRKVKTKETLEEKELIVQVTLVDCPGHLSLIRTIIGAAHILDLIVLVIDITKGIQLQTAECLIIANIFCRKLLVVVNKTDLIDEAYKEKTYEKVTLNIKKVLRKTNFFDSDVVFISAKNCSDHNSVEYLIEKIVNTVGIPKRTCSKPFLLAIDHCFRIKGKGTILTGTVLEGSLRVNESIELPIANLERRVKSIQIFQRSVSSIIQGDRVGICVSQLDPKLLERGYACKPNSLSFVYSFIGTFTIIPSHKSQIQSSKQFHISVGYETVLAKVLMFQSFQANKFSFNSEFELIENFNSQKRTTDSTLFALIQFNKPIIIPTNLVYIASRLDTQTSNTNTRLCFFGSMLHSFDDPLYEKTLSCLKIYKSKVKRGEIDRIVDSKTIIVKNIFKKESNISLFLNMKIFLSNGNKGTIESVFGKNGKVKVCLDDPLEISNSIQVILIEKK